MSQNASQSKRLFFALWPTAAEQQRFSEIALQASTSDSNRLVAAHRLHLTLSFLGSVDAATEVCARHVADTLAWQPFSLNIDRLGWFARPKVLWAGCTTIAPALANLVATLQEGMMRCSVNVDTRPFRPHITLARKVGTAPAQEKLNVVTCHFNEFSLVESRPERNGVCYETLARWPARVNHA